jgi:multidrug efflux pump subunit AcrA (membrane-fusion protein)
MKSRIITALAALGAAAALALAWISAPARAQKPAALPAPATIRAEGRLEAEPGAHVVVGTEMAGTIVLLAVKDRQEVKKGQVLVELRADEQRAALLEMEAQRRLALADEKQGLAEERAALASLKLGETQLRRAQHLAATGAVAQEQLDRAQRDHDDAEARLDQSRARTAGALARASAAQAGAERLRAVVQRARIVSPIDGVVLGHHAEEGETVTSGAALVTVADLRRTRVEAEVDEFDSPALREGAEVALSIEGLPGRSFRGRVSEIPDEVVPRQLKPEDPGRPSNTRVVRAKITLVDRAPLRLGQRVEVAIAR